MGVGAEGAVIFVVGDGGGCDGGFGGVWVELWGAWLRGWLTQRRKGAERFRVLG